MGVPAVTVSDTPTNEAEPLQHFCNYHLLDGGELVQDGGTSKKENLYLTRRGLQECVGRAAGSGQLELRLLERTCYDTLSRRAQPAKNRIESRKLDQRLRHASPHDRRTNTAVCREETAEYPPLLYDGAVFPAVFVSRSFSAACTDEQTRRKRAKRGTNGVYQQHDCHEPFITSQTAAFFPSSFPPFLFSSGTPPHVHPTASVHLLLYDRRSRHTL